MQEWGVDMGAEGGRRGRVGGGVSLGGRDVFLRKEGQNATKKSGNTLLCFRGEKILKVRGLRWAGADWGRCPTDPGLHTQGSGCFVFPHTARVVRARAI